MFTKYWIMDLMTLKSYSAGIYLLTIKAIETLEQGVIHSALRKKTSERRQCRRSGVFFVNFEHISQFFLVFLLNFKHVNVGWEFACKM